jgi:hypothetical protein
MKKVILSALLVTSALVTYATTWTVSNSTANPGQFNTMAAALTAAAAGDTLLVAGSGTTYGTFSIDKKLTLIGSGHHPQQQPALPTTAGNVSITVNDVSISGFSCNQILIGGVARIRVEFCEVRNVIQLAANATDCFIKSNLIANITLFATVNTLILNNVILDLLDGQNLAQSTLIVQNNTFVTYDYNTARVNGGNFTNNIFHAFTYYSTGNTNCTFDHNLAYSSGGNYQGGIGGNNLYANPLFISGTYRLQASSPAKTGGTSGSEIGAYGGGDSYSSTGEPRLPIIRTFDILNFSVQTGGTLNVNMTASKPRTD